MPEETEEESDDPDQVGDALSGIIKDGTGTQIGRFRTMSPREGWHWNTTKFPTATVWSVNHTSTPQSGPWNPRPKAGTFTTSAVAAPTPGAGDKLFEVTRNSAATNCAWMLVSGGAPTWYGRPGSSDISSGLIKFSGTDKLAFESVEDFPNSQQVWECDIASPP